ncbi:MAG TPA: metal-dependent hydrolase [Longimicrobium sp.]
MFIGHLPAGYLATTPLLGRSAPRELVVVLAVLRARRTAWLALAILGINVLLHLVLDTVAGGIRWLSPFSDVELALTTVRARYDPWVLNFVLHRTFALELALVVAALWRYRLLRSVWRSRGGTRSARGVRVPAVRIRGIQ